MYKVQYFFNWDWKFCSHRICFRCCGRNLHRRLAVVLEEVDQCSWFITGEIFSWLNILVCAIRVSYSLKINYERFILKSINSYVFQVGKMSEYYEKPSSIKCVVPSCTQKREAGVSFHKFPDKQRDQKRHNTWIRELHLKYPPNKYSVVCSQHFKVED